ncbi:MAG TPA: DUF559 domain-containing protein [Arthrobacter sp.]|nr:DUF559 domain-containing protein [Arthrobacter sp.]
MNTPEELLRHMQGHATREDLLRRHTSARLINASIRNGAIVRLRRGHYALPDLPAAPALAIECAGVLSHASAAQFWALSMIDTPREAHVTIRRNAHPVRPPHVRFHRRLLSTNDISPSVGSLQVTTPLRTVIDCAATMSFKDALSIADSALHVGMLTIDVLRAGAAAYRGRGAQNVRRVARHATHLAVNPMESALRAICIESRLGDFTPQFWVETAAGKYCLDLADVARKIDLEADGYEHHGHRKALHYDCTRNCELTRRGWLVLRFSWEHIMLHPEWVAEVIRDTLQQRRVRRGSKTC